MVKVKNQVPFSDSVTAVWVPKYIKQNQSMRAKDVVTSSDWNNLFNLVIAQGDWNSEAINKLINTGDFGIQFAAHAENADKLGGKLPAYYTEYADNVLSQSTEMFEEAKRYTDEVVTRIGAADMLMSTYDTNRNGIVDNAEALGGVPANTINDFVKQGKEDISDLQANKVNKSDMATLTSSKADKTLGNVDNTTFKNKIIASGYDSHTAGDIVFSYENLSKKYSGKYLELNGAVLAKSSYPAISGFFSNSQVSCVSSEVALSSKSNAVSIPAHSSSDRYYMGVAWNSDYSLVIACQCFNTSSFRKLLFSIYNGGTSVKNVVVDTSYYGGHIAIVGTKALVVCQNSYNNSYSSTITFALSANGGSNWVFFNLPSSGVPYISMYYFRLISCGEYFFLLYTRNSDDGDTLCIYIKASALTNTANWTTLNFNKSDTEYSSNTMHSIFHGGSKFIIGRLGSAKYIVVDASASGVTAKAVVPTYPNEGIRTILMQDSYRNGWYDTLQKKYCVYMQDDNGHTAYYMNSSDLITWNSFTIGSEKDTNLFPQPLNFSLDVAGSFNNMRVFQHELYSDYHQYKTSSIFYDSYYVKYLVARTPNITVLGKTHKVSDENIYCFSKVMDGASSSPYVIGFHYSGLSTSGGSYTCYTKKYFLRNVANYFALPNIAAQASTHGTNKRPYIRAV